MYLESFWWHLIFVFWVIETLCGFPTDLNLFITWFVITQFGYDTVQYWIPNWFSYNYTIYFWYSKGWIASMEIGLDPNNSVIKRLWYVVNVSLILLTLNQNVAKESQFRIFYQSLAMICHNISFALCYSWTFFYYSVLRQTNKYHILVSLNRIVEKVWDIQSFYYILLID